MLAAEDQGDLLAADDIRDTMDTIWPLLSDDDRRQIENPLLIRTA